ncbi:cysteine hydrolase [Aurantiacibacter sp. MUD11]|uniref:cysteine hydrolase family protein n=1 Tax=Aurantiacibacter sp. MUD11 TaxID=3003265 RepID=UPI0022AA8290|nr:isochorismatase family cysteine hydrolase [Aurantiacibacter sp. MUD11]WAT18368.1 cysteine hydrolase [Aurantiacibacter sp. MUD11]
MPHTTDHHEILDRVSEERGGTRNVRLAIDPRRTAQLVIDMQNGFVEEGAPVEVPAARDVAEPINRISKALREAGGLNVFVQYTTPGPDDPSWSTFYERFGPAAGTHKAAFQRGSHYWQLWPALEVEDGDIAVEKQRFSAFFPGASNLHEILQERGIDTVIVTGTMTNCCCESTARDAMQANYRVIFAPDANGASTEHEHAATLHTMGRIFADLWSSDELVALIEAAKAPA